MKQIKTSMAALLVGTLGMLFGTIGHADNSTHAIWVFPDDLAPNNPVTDQAARDALIDYSSSSGVTTLYLSVYQSIPNTTGRLMYEDSDIATLARTARRNRVRVWAAYGAPDWAVLGCDPLQFPLQRIAEVVDYNSDNPSARFKGVILDVEPAEPQSPTDFQNLLALYQCVRDAMPNYMGLAVAIRFFWDTPVEFDGVTKPVYQHIVDLDLDKIVVMGYRDFAGTPDCDAGDGVVCLDQEEIAYADSIRGKKRDRILVGLETGNCAPGCGPEKVTLYEEGQAQLNSTAQSVIDQFGDNASFGGFAIHRYGDSYLGGLSDWPVTNPEFP